MKKLIVNFTPTGMLIGKHQTPHIPLTPEEIIADVREACGIGISSVHLHARHPVSGDPVWEKEYFEEIILAIGQAAPSSAPGILRTSCLLRRNGSVRTARRMMRRPWNGKPG